MEQITEWQYLLWRVGNDFAVPWMELARTRGLAAHYRMTERHLVI